MSAYIRLLQGDEEGMDNKEEQETDRQGNKDKDSE